MSKSNSELISETGYSTKKTKQGRLKIFFGYADGVGKTYAMLDEVQELVKNGVDAVIGYIGTHTRPETMQLLYGLPVLHSKVIDYDNLKLSEFDLDEALRRKPELIIIDDLAHTNVYGVRNKKRYQDIEELLNIGIDVYTTVNVQNLESLKDLVQDITHIEVIETIPDYIFDNADKVEIIDIEPDQLLTRLRTGKIYKNKRIESALDSYFIKENLKLLREIAIRKVADRISHDNQNEPSLSEKMANIKLLVCIGSAPSSAKCIRWTARMAEAFHSPWIALYIEKQDSAYLREEEKAVLHSNMELVEQLGGEVVSLTGYDIASTVAEYAKRSGVTNIVIGKSRNKKTFKSLFEMDFEDKLISYLSNVEIHIIPNKNIAKSYHKPKKIFLHNNFTLSWKEAVTVIGILGGTTFLSIILKSLNVENQNMITLYILSVLVISRLTSGFTYGIVASLISVTLYNYLFTEPYFSLNTIQKGDWITFFIMLLGSLLTSALTVHAKDQAKFAVDKERRTELLYEINKKLLITRGLHNIVELTNKYITKNFHRSSIFYLKDPQEDSVGFLLQSEEEFDAGFMLSEEERAVARWVFINQKPAGAGTATHMGARALYIPVISQGNVLGVLGLSCINGTQLSKNNRSFLRMVASQVAMALERQHLSDEQRLILVESEKEKMRSNLLRAISHDLRTPLTGILGASSTILENVDILDEQTKIKLITNIKEESQWLIRMVENLLSVTRIDDASDVMKSPEAAEEIVAAAIRRIRKRFQERKIDVIVPDELLLVPMDGTLIEQVLINLIENAIKHSGEDTLIKVEIKKDDNSAIFEVSDNGEGIIEQDFPNLFKGYSSNEKKVSDSSRGMGIGLGICMSIIKAHHGYMEAKNRDDGGAVFRFTLPLDGGKNNEQ